MSFDPIPFDVLGGLLSWVIVMAIVVTIAAVMLVAGTLVAGGATGPLLILQEIKLGIRDWMGTSLRRIWAIVVLTFREAVRKKALLVGVVFAILFLFAGWFLNDVKSDMNLQVKVYVSFVLTTISWLILAVVLLLACWGLPEDIRARSLHTVVTKPVRRHEIVLGRMIGFIAVGAIALAIMGVIGYVWLERQIPESIKAKHLIARVPVYGQMTFLDREGNTAAAGVNTGDEWMFRSYVEGNTKATAIWDFPGVTSHGLTNEGPLLLESNFQSFRTWKGNIEKGLLCQYTLVNEAKKIRVPLKPFEIQENRDNQYDVFKENPLVAAPGDNNDEPAKKPAKLGFRDEDGKIVQLVDDLVNDGKLRVEARCLTGQQFIGMARPDLFVRLPDRPFAVSYFKGIFGIGLMLVMIVVLAVMASCFVKGPVAMILTIFVLLIGRTARPFFDTLTSSEWKGGGLIESIYRIIIHLNPTVPLESSVPVKIMQAIDSFGLHIMWAIKHMFPDFKYFEMSEYVANGYDVPFSAAILPSMFVTVGYVVPWIIVGYFSLKLRELETK